MVNPEGTPLGSSLKAGWEEGMGESGGGRQDLVKGRRYQRWGRAANRACEVPGRAPSPRGLTLEQL